MKITFQITVEITPTHQPFTFIVKTV